MTTTEQLIGLTYAWSTIVLTLDEYGDHPSDKVLAVD
jgi:hypothetical protein